MSKKKTSIPSTTVTAINHVEAGEKVRILREAKGVSLRKLAEDLSISAPFLSDLERGRRNWTTERFEKAIATLNKA